MVTASLVRAGRRDLWQPLELIVRNRNIILALSRSELADRYYGSLAGPVWAIGYPLFLMALYAFLFGYVFPMRIGAEGGPPHAFTVYILSGLVPWLVFAELLNKSPSLLTGNANLVKQLVFPIEVLIAKEVAVTFVSHVVLTGLLFLLVVYLWGHVPLTALMVVPLMMLQVLAMAGVAYVVSAVAVFFRDVRELVQMFTTAGLFLAPILYVPEWLQQLSPKLLWILYVNPFTHLVLCYRDAIYSGGIEHPWSWLILLVGSIATFMGGHWIFSRLKPVLGDVL